MHPDYAQHQELILYSFLVQADNHILLIVPASLLISAFY